MSSVISKEHLKREVMERLKTNAYVGFAFQDAAGKSRKTRSCMVLAEGEALDRLDKICQSNPILIFSFLLACFHVAAEKFFSLPELITVSPPLKQFESRSWIAIFSNQ